MMDIFQYLWYDRLVIYPSEDYASLMEQMLHVVKWLCVLNFFRFVIMNIVHMGEVSLTGTHFEPLGAMNTCISKKYV